MPHRMTSKPRTLRIGIDSLRAQLVEDRPFDPKADFSFRHVLRDQILDPLRRLEIEMLIAAGRAQAATVDSIGEHLLACLARSGSSVELRRQLGPRLDEIPFLVLRAGVWLQGLFGSDARRSVR